MTALSNALWIALVELRRNLTRSLLTSLGILIGVGAVIAMVGLGRGATASIEQDLSSFGSNMLMLIPGTGDGRPGGRTPAPAFDLADAEAIARQVRRVEDVAPQVSAPVTAVVGGRDWSTSVTGSTNGWFTNAGWELSEGRRFSQGELRSAAPVCVLGDTVREELLGRGEAIGASVRLDALTCTVIGVLEPHGENTFGMDQDDLIVAPIGTVQRRLLGSTDVTLITVSIDDPDALDDVTAELDALMRQRRNVASDAALNFQVRDTREMVDMVAGITGTMTAFLAAVAAVSLLVGGIGIMNIMLVNVTERTREIGVRMAVGALDTDVMTQFLVESVVLSALGGLLGIVLGIAGTAAGAALMDIPFIVDPTAVGLAVGVSALIGVAFGWWPARRAARLEPIDALRHS